MRFEEIMVKLPHLTSNKEIVDDWAFTPTLYHFDGMWCCTWMHCEDCDGLFNFTGSTPTEAAMKAYDWCRDNNLIK